MAAFGVLAALRERERSGEGQLVDVSMTDGSLSWLAMVAARLPLRRRGAASAGELSSTGGFVCYLPYEAADGWVTLRRPGAEVLARLLRAVERPDLIEQQFEAPGSDAWREVAEIFKARTRDEWRGSTTSTTR